MNGKNYEESQPMELVLAIVTAANSHREPQKLINGWDRQVLLRIDDQPIALGFASGIGTLLGSAEPAPKIHFNLSKSTLIDLMCEKYSPLTAKLMGRIQSGGNMIDILRFSSILSSAVKCLK